MNRIRKSKYFNQVSSNKYNIKFDLNALNLFCAYVISNNKNIKRSSLIKFKALIDRIDMEYYLNEPDKLNRLKFIQKGLDARVTHNLNDSNMVMMHIRGDMETDIDLDIHDRDLNNSEIDWIDKKISDCLRYQVIQNEISNLNEYIAKIGANEYDSMEQSVGQFENVLNRISLEFRKYRAEDISESGFIVGSSEFKDTVKQYANQLRSPTNKLLTGSQAINKMTSGGFESGRVYMYFGLPGEGKSTLLLNLAYQIKKYNKGYIPKDPTKRPCVVVLSMENSARETWERLFVMSTGRENITDYSDEEIFRLMETEGELYVNAESPITIAVKYVPGGSVNTDYLYTLFEELEEEGYEPICLIQDYVKRIKSIDNFYGDTRLELGAVVNEFKVFASIKDVPVITASQLNRDATTKIDDARNSKQSDLVRRLGRSNIGESMLMLENLDAAFTIAPEFDPVNCLWYLGVGTMKTRYKQSDLQNAFIPYCGGTRMKLMEDFYSPKPLYKDTLISSIPPSFDTGSTALGNPSLHVDIEDNMFDDNSEESLFTKMQRMQAARDIIYPILIRPISCMRSCAG